MKKLDVFETHQLKIAKDTLKMPDAIANVMGGPTKKQAKEIIKKLEGKCKHINVTYHQYIKNGSSYCNDCGKWLTIKEVNNSEYMKRIET